VRAGGLAVAALLVMSTAGAAVTSPPLERLWSAPIQGHPFAGFLQSAADEQRLYLGALDRAASSGEPAATLTAYRLSDGRVEWVRPLEASQPPHVRLAGGRVLVSTSALGSPGATTAYDVETGQELWTHPAPAFQVLAEWVVLFVETSRPADAAEPQVELLVVDPDTPGKASVSLPSDGTC
jgi:hypothetical protein